MKMIVAIIKPLKLDDAREALSKVDIKGMTVTEVKGFGRQKGHTEHYRGSQYTIEFLPKLKIEVAVTDSQVDTVKNALISAVGSGQIGDGKIFILNLEEAVRIRTGETGDDAI